MTDKIQEQVLKEDFKHGLNMLEHFKKHYQHVCLDKNIFKQFKEDLFLLVNNKISRTIELMEEKQKDTFRDITEEIIRTDEKNKQKADFRKMIEVELKESKFMLRNSPLNDYWLGREILLAKLLAKLGDDKEAKEDD